VIVLQTVGRSLAIAVGALFTIVQVKAPSNVSHLASGCFNGG